jgi:hypothetical protein
MMGWMAPLRHLGAKLLADANQRANREPSMSEITTIGLDLGKHVFQVHGVDAEGAVVLRKQLRRGQVLSFFSRLSARARARVTPRSPFDENFFIGFCLVPRQANTGALGALEPELAPIGGRPRWLRTKGCAGRRSRAR